MARWLLIALGFASVRLHQTVTAALVHPSNREELEPNTRDLKSLGDYVHGNILAEIPRHLEG
jgi:hypothetical protein